MYLLSKLLLIFFIAFIIDYEEKEIKPRILKLVVNKLNRYLDISNDPAANFESFQNSSLISDDDSIDYDMNQNHEYSGRLSESTQKKIKDVFKMPGGRESNVRLKDQLIVSHKSEENQNKKPVTLKYEVWGLIWKWISSKSKSKLYKVFSLNSSQVWCEQESETEFTDYQSLKDMLKKELYFPVTVVYK